MKRTFLVFFTLLFLLIGAGCGNPSPDKTEVGGNAADIDADDAQNAVITAEVSRDVKYNAANVALSPEAFADAGFLLGDGCDLTFSNGFTLSDVPYYNGYYVKNGEPVIVAYPGFSNVSITYNNMGIWEQAGLRDGDTVTICLSAQGKYSAVQDSLGQVYSFERKAYPSDEAFCNFRALSGGKLKEGFLFRGASPVDNSRGRAAYTDGLLEAAGIRFVVDLADSDADMSKYLAFDDFRSAYTSTLYANGQVVLLSMSSAYQSDDYRQKLVSGLREMVLSEGPVYIHCMEGKDRTGFVCMLLEALAGASYEEMRSDYMQTYGNYYSVYPDKTPEKYEAISALYFDAFAAFLHGTEDIDALTKADYTRDAENYLISGGMSEEELHLLIRYITE